MALYVTFFDIMDYIGYEGVFILSRILLNGLHYENHGAGISKYTQMLLKHYKIKTLKPLQLLHNK